MPRNLILVLTLISIGLMSTYIKLFQNSDLPEAQRREIDTITKYISIRDLSLVKSFKLNREGSFNAYIFKHKHCNGGWLISPMYRNSEAEALFKRQAV